MLFYKNRNTQIQVCKIQRLEQETGKTCEACSIVHWEVLSPSPYRVNSSYKLTYT